MATTATEVQDVPNGVDGAIFQVQGKRRGSSDGPGRWKDQLWVSDTVLTGIRGMLGEYYSWVAVPEGK